MKKIIISLIGFILALILIFLFIIPKWNSCSLLRDKILKEENRLNWLTAQIDKVNMLEKEYQNLESEAKNVFLALPREEDIPNLLIQFEALASDSRLVFDSISFGRIVEQKKSAESMSMATGEATKSSLESDASSQELSSPLRELNVDISISGTYNNLKNYLNSLSNNMRSMDVKSISLDSSGDSYKFNLAIVVYYQ